MTERQVFFDLDAATRNRLRGFMSVLAITACLQVLISSQAPILIPVVVFGITGIGISMALLLFSIFITRAPTCVFESTAEGFSSACSSVSR